MADTFHVAGTGVVAATGNPPTPAAVAFLPGSFSFLALTALRPLSYVVDVRNLTPAVDDFVEVSILVPGAPNWNVSVINTGAFLSAVTGEGSLSRSLNGPNGVYNPATDMDGAVVAIGSKHGGTYEVDFTVTYWAPPRGFLPRFW